MALSRRARGGGKDIKISLIYIALELAGGFILPLAAVLMNADSLTGEWHTVLFIRIIWYRG